MEAYARWTTNLCGHGFLYFTATTCFRPGDVGIAESRLPVSPLRPTAVVWEFTRLRLQREALYVAQEPAGLSYLYGRIPVNLQDLPAFALPSPHYVLVTERVGRVTGFKGRVVYNNGSLEYDANFPHRNLRLQVQSNASRRLVREIGQGVILEDTGK